MKELTTKDLLDALEALKKEVADLKNRPPQIIVQSSSHHCTCHHHCNPQQPYMPWYQQPTYMYGIGSGGQIGGLLNG